MENYPSRKSTFLVRSLLGALFIPLMLISGLLFAYGNFKNETIWQFAGGTGVLVGGLAFVILQLSIRKMRMYML